jgi:hypothetical protein
MTMRKLFRLLAVLSVMVSGLVAVGGVANASPMRILSNHDRRCLDVYAGGAGPWVQVWGCTGGANQRFHQVNYPDGTLEIRTDDYWCVDGRWGKGASLERSPCTGHPGQRWRVRVDPYPNRVGYLMVSAQYPNLIWDVHGFGSGTKVQLWEHNYGANQSWLWSS